MDYIYFFKLQFCLNVLLFLHCGQQNVLFLFAEPYKYFPLSYTKSDLNQSTSYDKTVIRLDNAACTRITKIYFYRLTHKGASSPSTLLVWGLSMRGFPFSLVCVHLQAETWGIRHRVVLNLDSIVNYHRSGRSAGRFCVKTKQNVDL